MNPRVPLGAKHSWRTALKVIACLTIFAGGVASAQLGDGIIYIALGISLLLVLAANII